MKLEIRNPRAEIRGKSEYRNPKEEDTNRVGRVLGITILWVFGFAARSQAGETKAVVINKGIKCRLGVWPDDIVPIAMKRVPFQVHLFHLFVGYFSPGRIFPAIQATRHFQPFGRGRVGNQAHDGFVIP